MKLGSSKAIFGTAATAVLCLGAMVSSAAGQATPAKKPAVKAAAEAKTPARRKIPVGTAQKPLLAEQAFTNIQVFKGVPATQFMDVMGFFSASLVETCTFCHSDESDGSWPHYADDTNPIKNTARQMVRMTDAINKANFNGEKLVTCYSCHNGAELPKTIPSLLLQYSPPAAYEPDSIDKQNPNAPLPNVIIAKYLTAIGGADRAAALKSFVAKGTYEGYSASLRGSVDFYAKAPNQQSLTLHTDSGDSIVVFNGVSGWISGPDDLTPLPVAALSGSELEGIKTDSQLAFPGQIMKTLTKWRTGSPIQIGDKDVQVVQGSMPTAGPVKLYFDSKTGLLVREIRFIKTPVGLNPYQIDYDNYKDVSGLKMPFHMVITWTDGRSTMDFTDIQQNVDIPATQFKQPAAPKPQELKDQDKSGK